MLTNKRVIIIIMAYIQKNNPIKKTSCGRRRSKAAGNSPFTKKPCWKGYEMIGMKNKGGRKVPNCVPK